MIQLLDCTLRDGGYVNDWEFGSDVIGSVYARLADSGVDIVEIGFLDDRRPFDPNRSIMPDTDCADRIYGPIPARPPMAVGMIDYGTCRIENLKPCAESYLDGIRVIFKKHRMHEALDFCAQVKNLGYKVFAQLVSVTSYEDDELIELAKLVNDVHPYVVSMVDTYGLVQPDRLRHIFGILDSHVDRDIGIGFHAHNNFQLAFANSMLFLELAKDRDVIVDGTLFGMGKGAGNAPLELVAMHLNERYGKSYKINPMLDAIEECIADIYKTRPWGYKTYFYMAAYNGVHPDYVRQIQNKPNVSVSAINDVLGDIGPGDSKLLYNREAGEAAYERYERAHDVDEESTGKLRALIEKAGHVLLIGPGKSVRLQKDRIEQYISDAAPLVISINYIPEEIGIDDVFVTKSNRYVEMSRALGADENAHIGVIATSNVDAREKPFDIVFAREPLLEVQENIVDNSLLMLLKILDRCGVTEIALAGFDGYSDRDDNYFNPKMEYSFIKNEAFNLNRHMRYVINEVYSHIRFEFVTYSRYTDVHDSYDTAF